MGEIEDMRRLTKGDLEVLSFGPPVKNDYPFSFPITAPFDPDREGQNPFHYKWQFEVNRFEDALRIRTENMIHHLEAEGVYDFNTVRNNKVVDFSFRSIWELNIAKMAYLPEKEYVVPLKRSHAGVTTEEIAEELNSIKASFNATGRSGVIRFEYDNQSEAINAITSNRRAYIDLVGNEREISLAP